MAVSFSTASTSIKSIVKTYAHASVWYYKTSIYSLAPSTTTLP
ncbi:UNVERIFIED_CONTAM: hypothetical protein GTU68_023809 [Idotea baltica]|nr:hypothetical protein [Idotea baltica]